jgi:hypothetical protein
MDGNKRNNSKEQNHQRLILLQFFGFAIACVVIGCFSFLNVFMLKQSNFIYAGYSSVILFIFEFIFLVYFCKRKNWYRYQENFDKAIMCLNWVALPFYASSFFPKPAFLIVFVAITVSIFPIYIVSRRYFLKNVQNKAVPIGKISSDVPGNRFYGAWGGVGYLLGVIFLTFFSGIVVFRLNVLGVFYGVMVYVFCVIFLYLFCSSLFTYFILKQRINSGYSKFLADESRYITDLNSYQESLSYYSELITPTTSSADTVKEIVKAKKYYIIGGILWAILMGYLIITSFLIKSS